MASQIILTSSLFQTWYIPFFLIFGLGGFVVLVIILTIREESGRFSHQNTWGNIGEWQVANILRKLNPEQFVVLNDIMFEKTQTGANEIATTQIDHIVVSVFGIFVIETKNYSGKIYGTEKSQKWQYYSHGKKYEFYNPLKQNFKHTKTIQDLLMRNASQIGIVGADFLIYPIIAFSGNAEIRVKVSGADVVYFGNVPDAIRSHCTQPVLTRQQVDSIVNCILYHNVNSEEKKREHVYNIHKTVYEREHGIPHNYSQANNAGMRTETNNNPDMSVSENVKTEEHKESMEDIMKKFGAGGDIYRM